MSAAPSGVVAIVPAYNEAGRVAPAVVALMEFCDTVVVVDDGSSDATAHEAEHAGALLVRLPRNRGKGAALAAGIAAVPSATILLLADADLASSASSLRAIIQPVASGNADIAIAAPPPARASGFGLVEGLARWATKRMTGRTLARPLSGQRAMTGRAARSLALDRRFGVETGMNIDALRAGLRVVEVPCAFTHAATGRDAAGFSHRARQGIGVASAIGARFLRSLRSAAKRGNVAP